MERIVVDRKGTGDFCSLGEALSHTDGECEIFLKNGTYREKISVDKPDIHIIGEDREKTVIVFGDYALMERVTGYPIGTFETPTMRVYPEAQGFIMKNLTVSNDAGEGNIVGQAVALYIDCDRAYIENCAFLGRQDTLLAGPIPEDITGKAQPYVRQYFKNCRIEGNVDFIFGGAAAIFERCEIFIVGREGFPSGYVTAACTSEENDFGYIFRRCSITGSGNRERAFLGRPWRDYAKTVFIDCTWDDILNPEVFSVWNGRESHKTCCFGFRGMDAYKTTKADWVRYISEDEAEGYSKKNVFGDWEV